MEPVETSRPLEGARIGTVLIFTRDFQRMISFYRDTLGLTAVRTSERFAELTTGTGVSVSLHAAVSPTSKAGDDLLIDFLVDDVDRVAAALRERGVEVDPVRDEPFGRITQFLDPEGHMIGIEQPKRRAKQ